MTKYRIVTNGKYYKVQWNWPIWFIWSDWGRAHNSKARAEEELLSISTVKERTRGPWRPIE